MAVRLSVNPNRMELLRLRRRLMVAQRGHKLLKDKFDALMKPFLVKVRETRDLRLQVERELLDAHCLFAIAQSETSKEEMDEALSHPKASLEVSVIKASLVSVAVPHFELTLSRQFDCYGLASTPAILDEALEKLKRLLPRLVELAEEEKAVTMLAEEIKKTRRRVNALEYVLIPQLEETVRFITMKLDEFERANLTRLMKIKEMVAEST